MRSRDYLKQEFMQRILRGPVKYKLQMTLHQAQSDDAPGILDIARYWDETTHDWLNVADVTLTSLLTPDVATGMRFNVSTLPDSLYLLPARSIHDSNCIAHIRKEVYALTQMIRRVRSSILKPDHVTTYVICVEAGVNTVRSNANISISLTGM